MGSGSFPLSRLDGDGAKLVQAAALVDEVTASMSDAVYSGDSGGSQFDNAASDGGSLALLYLAASLIRDQVARALAPAQPERP